jgi:HNH endonuclease
MTISVKTQKMLWGRAAGRCSKPDCRLDLYEDETETDDPTLVGENCHIVAESDDGPRADPSMPLERRNSYANLILLCRNHHKVIDAQEGEYTVSGLHEMKAVHEAWVAAQLGFDAAKQRDDELYAGMIETWERLAHVDEWLDWGSRVLGGGQPSMRVEIDRDLRELRSWLLNRVWPRRYPSLNEHSRISGESLRTFTRPFENTLN